MNKLTDLEQKFLDTLDLYCTEECFVKAMALHMKIKHMQERLNQENEAIADKKTVELLKKGIL